MLLGNTTFKLITYYNNTLFVILNTNTLYIPVSLNKEYPSLVKWDFFNFNFKQEKLKYTLMKFTMFIDL